MSTADARIVVITADAALVIGLTFAAREWDVDSQPELTAGEDADVVVLDTPAVVEGLAEVDRYGLPRVVILADAEYQGVLPEGIIALPRPYTVEELVSCIDHLLAPDSTERPVRWVPDVASPDAGADEGGPDVTIDLTEPGPEPQIIQHRAAAAPSPTEAPVPIRRTRWRARRQRHLSGSERAFRERLAQVLAATSELERLIAEVPLLEDLTALSAAILQEVGHALRADSVGLWRPGPTGWQVQASRGFSPHERRLIVAFDQPLFAEVHASGGSLLIDPVESVQAAVAGIGGAHTESFMAAAIAAGPGRYGIIAVGRNEQLLEADLSLLEGLVLDIAPGIAVAEQLERLRARGPAPERERAEQTPTAPEQTATIVLPDVAPTGVT